MLLPALRILFVVNIMVKRIQNAFAVCNSNTNVVCIQFMPVFIQFVDIQRFWQHTEAKCGNIERIEHSECEINTQQVFDDTFWVVWGKMVSHSLFRCSCVYALVSIFQSYWCALSRSLCLSFTFRRNVCVVVVHLYNKIKSIFCSLTV